MRILTGLVILWAPLLAVQSDRQFKAFYAEGKTLFDESNYAEAAEKFKQALRLDPKPQRIRTEGTYFEPYQPRFWLARCYEHLDPLVAADWVKQSRQAAEREVDKNRKSVATYNEITDRILESATKAEQQRQAALQLKLNEANSFLENNRFDEAETIFREVYTEDPQNAVAFAGIEKVRVTKNAYLDAQNLEARLALNNGEIDRAESIYARIKQIDPKHPKLPILAEHIQAAQEQSRQAQLEAQQQASQQQSQSDRAERPQPRATDQAEHSSEPSTTPSNATRVSQPSKTGEAGQAAEPDASAIREALLDSLKPYRHGDAKAALAKLNAIELTGLTSFESYHWLRALFLLTIAYQSPDHDRSTIPAAEEALRQVLRMQPDFNPNPRHYPAYVLRHLDRVRKGSQPSK